MRSLSTMSPEGNAYIRYPLAILVTLALLAVPAQAQTMQISPGRARHGVPGAAANFAGSVMVTPLFAPTQQSNAAGGQVEFAPGARSAWHTHPLGQWLIVTAGSGWVQQEGGPKIAIKPGDVVYTPPGVKHWHGATASSSLTHIAITPTVAGKNVEWMEPVTEAQYREAAEPRGEEAKP